LASLAVSNRRCLLDSCCGVSSTPMDMGVPRRPAALARSTAVRSPLLPRVTL
jgi:hypothetical protein